MKEYVFIKKWFYDKISETSMKYHFFINCYNRDENGMIPEEVKVLIEDKLNESEKAIQVVLATGYIDGSYKGWKTWIPKSVLNK